MVLVGVFRSHQLLLFTDDPHPSLTTQLELKLPSCVRRDVSLFMPGETEEQSSKKLAGSLTHQSWESQSGCVDMDIAIMLREETRKVQQSMEELFAKQSQTLAELQHQISSIANQQASGRNTNGTVISCCDYFWNCRLTIDHSRLYLFLWKGNHSSYHVH